jgi:hypothetical protein
LLLFFTLEREGGHGFFFSFSKLLKGKGGMDIFTFLVFFFLTFEGGRGTWVIYLFNSFSFQRMGTKDRVGGSTGCIMHRVPTSSYSFCKFPYVLLTNMVVE